MSAMPAMTTASALRVLPPRSAVCTAATPSTAASWLLPRPLRVPRRRRSTGAWSAAASAVPAVGRTWVNWSSALSREAVTWVRLPVTSFCARSRPCTPWSGATLGLAAARRVGTGSGRVSGLAATGAGAGSSGTTAGSSMRAAGFAAGGAATGAGFSSMSRA